MDKLLKVLNVQQNSNQILDPTLYSVRKLIFDDSNDLQKPKSEQEKPNSVLLQKVIQKPILKKSSTPNKLLCKNPLTLVQSKSFTPIPEVKSLSMLKPIDFKIRSSTSLGSAEEMKVLAMEDVIIEDESFLKKSKKPYDFISPEELAEIIQKKEEEFVLLDCRYTYEFQGGHIKNAININNDPGKLLELFPFPNDSQSKTDETIENMIDSSNGLMKISSQTSYSSEKEKNASLETFWSPTKEIKSKFSDLGISEKKFPFSKKKIIFHCEFSQARGPKMYQLLRSYDREINYFQYPKLTYPNLCILEGGYSHFVEKFPDLCEPKGGYTKMKNKGFSNEFIIEHNKTKKNWELITKNREEVIKVLMSESITPSFI